MAATVNRWLMVLALGSAAIPPSTQPAAALTAELAKLAAAWRSRRTRPRDPARPAGSAAAQRAYFQQCVENNGKMPDGAPSQPPK